jgi:hypothetical protein
MGALWKIALWTSSLGTAALLFRRARRRRRAALDVGTVSDEWLANQRGIADSHF